MLKTLAFDNENDYKTNKQIKTIYKVDDDDQIIDSIT